MKKLSPFFLIILLLIGITFAVDVNVQLSDEENQLPPEQQAQKLADRLKEQPQAVPTQEQATLLTAQMNRQLADTLTLAAAQNPRVLENPQLLQAWIRQASSNGAITLDESGLGAVRIDRVQTNAGGLGDTAVTMTFTRLGETATYLLVIHINSPTLSGIIQPTGFQLRDGPNGAPGTLLTPVGVPIELPRGITPLSVATVGFIDGRYVVTGITVSNMQQDTSIVLGQASSWDIGLYGPNQLSNHWITRDDYGSDIVITPTASGDGHELRITGTSATYTHDRRVIGANGEHLVGEETSLLTFSHAVVRGNTFSVMSGNFHLAGGSSHAGIMGNVDDLSLTGDAIAGVRFAFGSETCEAPCIHRGDDHRVRIDARGFNQLLTLEPLPAPSLDRPVTLVVDRSSFVSVVNYNRYTPYTGQLELLPPMNIVFADAEARVNFQMGNLLSESGARTLVLTAEGYRPGQGYNIPGLDVRAYTLDGNTRRAIWNTIRGDDGILGIVFEGARRGTIVWPTLITLTRAGNNPAVEVEPGTIIYSNPAFRNGNERGTGRYFRLDGDVWNIVNADGSRILGRATAADIERLTNSDWYYQRGDDVRVPLRFLVRTQSAEAEAIVHTLRAGESPWSIAERYRIGGRNWGSIIILENGEERRYDSLTTQERLELGVGTRMRIPGTERTVFENTRYVEYIDQLAESNRGTVSAEPREPTIVPDPQIIDSTVIRTFNERINGIPGDSSLGSILGARTMETLSGSESVTNDGLTLRATGSLWILSAPELEDSVTDRRYFDSRGRELTPAEASFLIARDRAAVIAGRGLNELANAEIRLGTLDEALSLGHLLTRTRWVLPLTYGELLDLASQQRPEDGPTEEELTQRAINEEAQRLALEAEIQAINNAWINLPPVPDPADLHPLTDSWRIDQSRLDRILPSTYCAETSCTTTRHCTMGFCGPFQLGGKAFREACKAIDCGYTLVDNRVRGRISDAEYTQLYMAHLQNVERYFTQERTLNNCAGCTAEDIDRYWLFAYNNGQGRLESMRQEYMQTFGTSGLPRFEEFNEWIPNSKVWIWASNPRRMSYLRAYSSPPQRRWEEFQRYLERAYNPNRDALFTSRFGNIQQTASAR